MKAAVVGALVAALAVEAAPAIEKRDVYTNYPYTGPQIPVADWVDQTVNGNGKGFIRLMEDPAVKPAKANPTNNINVISLAYTPGGINIHYQTPFGLGVNPTVVWGMDRNAMGNTATGATTTYDRTPPCSLSQVKQCSQFFHDVQITGLAADTTYYYQIQAANGTTESDILSFVTARAAGTAGEFTVGVLNDMGYTNAAGTHKQMLKAMDDGAAFFWHGGDISYADDWYDGILACESDWDVCYNGSSSELPFGITDQYKNNPLPAGEIPDQGGPYGGDSSPLYETNWDIWQQWMNPIMSVVPYMVNPGNHEAACAEFDGTGQAGPNTLATYLNDDKANSTSNSELTYYSCPPSQRNFTAYQHRFRMPGEEVGGRTNFWYSFDYGLAHFVSFDGETDYAYSPEYPFQRDVYGTNETLPTPAQTYETDSGPFGYIQGGIPQVYNNSAYEQVQWLAKDLAAVNRSVTPWVIAMSHRPMYSSQTSSYQTHMRSAFQQMFINAGVDAYIAGHIHWYERTYPLMSNGSIDHSSVKSPSVYYTNPGVSMTHLINGQAGNIESHSTLGSDPILALTNVLNQEDYGFSTLTFHNSTALTWTFIRGDNGNAGDTMTLLKRS